MNTRQTLKTCLCVTLLLLSLFRAASQNLVLNPSFENAPPSNPLFTCPGFGDLVNWDRVETDTCSTPDLFTPACSGLFAILGAPSNNFGTQVAHSGTNYTGAYFIESSNYREYIQGKLSAPLVAGQQYCVSFYVSFPENVPEASNRIDVYFSNTHVAVNMCNTPILPFTPQLEACTATMITDKTNWVRLQWNYTATGGETYLVIGNFFNNAATTTSVVGVGMPGSYYYMDDVSVEAGTCCHTDIAPTSTLCSSGAPITLGTTPVLNANCTTTNTPGTWSGAGITNPVTGVFNPSTAGPGSHTVSYSLTCGYTATTSIYVDPCAISVCKTGSVMTASGGTAPYTWQAQTTYTDCSGCPGGNCIPFFCAGSVVTTWTTVATNTPTYTSSAFPMRVLDNAGNTYTITSLASLSTCSTSICPSLTLAVSSQTNVNCYGASTGSATVNASGGAAAYNYTWAPGGLTGASQTGLPAGTYTIAIKDANACPGSGTVTITQPVSAVGATITGTSPASCGSGNGSATVTANGGTPGYTYNWSPSGGTAATTSPVSAGAYTVTVTDSKGCTKTAATTINSAGGPTLSVVSQASVSCFGASTGSATVGASGGTGSYTYTWSPGNLNGNSQNGLAAGVYTVQVKDAGNCISSGTLSIAQPGSAVGATVTPAPATCGLSNGSATVIANGGTPGYTYSWSPSGGTGTTASSLAAGNYSVLVTDNKGCTKTTAATISSTGGPTVSVTSQANVNCFGASTGSATVGASGGTGPYTYTWSPGNMNGASQSSLAAGTYTINSTDAGGCIGSATVTLTQPASALSAAVSSTTASTCGLSMGGATVTAGGGTPGYTYAWSPSGGNAAGANGLAAGNYTVTVTDNKGCTKTASTLINSAGGPTVTVSSQTNVSCFGGNNGGASLSAAGGSGSYTYTWSPSGGSASSASGLVAGNYTVTVSDGNCTSFAVLTLTQGPAISATVTIGNASCAAADGSATVTASGGTGGLSYAWSPGGATTSSISNLGAGAYTVTVTDSKNCTYSASGIISVSGSGFPVDAGASAVIEPGGNVVLHGTGPAGSSYSWSPPEGLSCTLCQNPTASPGETTTYTLTVTNAGGCTSSDTVTVIVRLPCGELFVPTAFSPNNDGQNDVLFVNGNCITDMEFAIFDRWGEKVFESTSAAQGWDGTFAGKKLDPAVFAYYIKATVNNEQISKHGSITIVK